MNIFIKVSLIDFKISPKLPGLSLPDTILLLHLQILSTVQMYSHSNSALMYIEIISEYIIYTL